MLISFHFEGVFPPILLLTFTTAKLPKTLIGTGEHLIFKACGKDFCHTCNQFHNILRFFDVLPSFFLSPQMKQGAIITYEHGIHQLLHELLNYLRLRIFGN